MVGQKKFAGFKRADKAASIKLASIFAEQTIRGISKEDLFYLGVGIYIGEGSKTVNIVRVVNSDPRIIFFMMQWFRECFGLANSNFRIRIHAYPDNDQENLLDFWSKTLKLDKHYFQPIYVDRRTNKVVKKKKVLPYGTAHLSVVSNGNKEHGALLHRKIIASIDRVLNIKAGLV